MRALTDCKRVFFLHMRKAGGSTVRALLNKICTERNIVFVAREGYSLEQFGAMDEDTFVVLNFRHPVERICTLYNAEGSWPEPVEACRSGDKARESTVDFEEWFEQKRAIQHPRSAPLWRVPKNYYVKTLFASAGERVSEPEIHNKEISSEEYRSAIAGLQRVDLVLITEWLRHEVFARYLAKRLLGSEALQLKIPRLNRTAMFRGPFDIRRHLSHKQWQRIKDANRWDMELYRFVCWRAALEAGIDMGNCLGARVDPGGEPVI